MLLTGCLPFENQTVATPVSTSARFAQTMDPTRFGNVGLTKGKNTSSDLVSSAIKGMNFTLHAVAVFLFAMYRPVRERKQFASRKKFQVLSYGMFIALSVFQIFSVLSLAGFKTDHATQLCLVVFNILRILFCLSALTGFLCLPNRMPRRGPYKLTRTQAQTISTATRRDVTLTTKIEKGYLRKIYGSMCFDFVQWNRTAPPHAHRRIDMLSDETVRRSVLRSDLSSRVMFYVNAAFIATLVYEGHAQEHSSKRIHIGSHSLAFGVTFHFLYILFGYGIRGGRARMCHF